VSQAAFRIVALFMANDNQPAISQSSKTADNGLIIPKVPITSQRCELVKQSCCKIFEMRALRMAGDLCFLPRSQLRIGVTSILADLTCSLSISVWISSEPSSAVSLSSRMRDSRAAIGFSKSR
jgi:hypothetical protein